MRLKTRYIMAALVAVVLSFCSLADGADTEIDKLYDAIVQVESGGNPRAVGDGGKAVGIAQIHPIMVKDVNRILKTKKGGRQYSLKDRYCPIKSKRMFTVYVGHYCDGKTTLQAIARRWNGGPMGDKKKATLAYWKKVKRALRSGGSVLAGRE